MFVFTNHHVNHAAADTVYGSTVLKSLQNESIPMVDLLVREAIQNSADAALGYKDYSYSNVEFNTGKFRPQSLNQTLPGLGEELDARYGSNFECDYLEIRDSKTKGLNGPIDPTGFDSTTDHGNYFKLIFDLGKKQREDNAGGNWGYGKSVYYRSGIGLVIFYSRTEDEDGLLQSRIIATMIEDEEDRNSLLRCVDGQSAGRAWWGEGLVGNDVVTPITDEGKIAEFLEIFGLEPYAGTNTGTSVIIPYISQEGLLQGSVPEDPSDVGMSDEDVQRCEWKDDLAKYIELAIQRWYAPKLQNTCLENLHVQKQKFLRVKVNGVGIVKETMHPFFALVQELYTAGLQANEKMEYSPEYFPGYITVEEVPCRAVSGGIGGHLAWATIRPADLDQGDLSPYILANRPEGKAGFCPIVLFAREPGMVINYEAAPANEWAHGFVSNQESYTVAFFVPSSMVKIHKDAVNRKRSYGEHGGERLTEYLRDCEASDHAHWNDPSGLSIVSNLKKQVSILLTPKGTSQLHSGEQTASLLSGQLGRLFLPSLSNGPSSSSSQRKGGGKGQGGRRSGFRVEGERVTKTGVETTLSAQLARGLEKELRVEVGSEVGSIPPASWEEDIGTRFPVSFASICGKVTAVESDSGGFDFVCDENSPKFECDVVDISLNRGAFARDYVSVSLASKDTDVTIEATVELHASDRRYECNLKFV